MQSLIKVHSYGVIIMDFDWERFMDVAEHLRNYSNREEYQRTAVGRYYYACFLKAREIYYDFTGTAKGTKISHNDLIRKYQGSKNKYAKLIGNNLEVLFKNRKNADYDKEFDFNGLAKNKELSNDVFNLFKKLK